MALFYHTKPTITFLPKTLNTVTIKPDIRDFTSHITTPREFFSHVTTPTEMFSYNISPGREKNCFQFLFRATNCLWRICKNWKKNHAGHRGKGRWCPLRDLVIPRLGGHQKWIIWGGSSEGRRVREGRRRRIRGRRGRRRAVLVDYSGYVSTGEFWSL